MSKLTERKGKKMKLFARTLGALSRSNPNDPSMLEKSHDGPALSAGSRKLGTAKLFAKFTAILVVCTLAVIGTVHAATEIFEIGDDGLNDGNLYLYGDSSTKGGKTFFFNGNSRDSNINKYMVGISTSFNGDFTIRAIEPNNSTYTVFRVLDTNHKTHMNYGLELWNYSLFVEEGIDLGTAGASISNDGGDVVVMLGN